MNYTKGEWIYEEELLANMSMISCDNKVIAGIPNDVSEDKGAYLEQVANANLIAAAPDNYTVNSETLRLYCYLKEYRSDLWFQIIDECPGILDHWMRIQEALAKSEGGN